MMVFFIKIDRIISFHRDDLFLSPPIARLTAARMTKVMNPSSFSGIGSHLTVHPAANWCLFTKLGRLKGANKGIAPLRSYSNFS